MTAKSTVLDCFCGIGGISLGCQMAGLEVVGAFDHNESALRTFLKLFPKSKIFPGDFLKIKPNDLLKELGLRQGDIDFLVGGPPCQPFSVYNRKRSEKDHRAKLIDSYLALAAQLKPRWILIENVPGIVSIGNYRFLEKILKTLDSAGYSAGYQVLNAINFGVPQRRKRVFVLGSQEKNAVQKVLARLANRPCRGLTVYDAIGDLPIDTMDPTTYVSRPLNAFQRLMRRDSKRSVTRHLGRGLGRVNLQRAKYVPPGGNWRKIPVALLPAGMRRARLSDHTTRYGRLRYDAPAYTVLTKCDPHWGCYLHPMSNRVLTVREAARLQSIPDIVSFDGDLEQQYTQVGNAVPPLVAKAIIEEIQS